MKAKLKKIIKISAVVIAVLLVTGIIFANIDYIRTKNNKPPILAVYAGKNKYTNADIYYGLGYTVVKCPEYKTNNEVEYELNNQKPYKLYFLSGNHACVQSYDVIIFPEE